MTNEDLAQIRTVIREGIREEMDRSMEALTANLSDLRNEMTSRFDSSDRRIDRLSETTGSLHKQLAAINTQLSGMHRWADSLDTDNLKLHDTVSQLQARLTRVERALKLDQPL